MIPNGHFIYYIVTDSLDAFFELMPHLFYDGKVCETAFSSIVDINDNVKEHAQ